MTPIEREIHDAVGRHSDALAEAEDKYRMRLAVIKQSAIKSGMDKDEADDAISDAWEATSLIRKANDRMTREWVKRQREIRTEWKAA